jgi:DNA-directed RNA polymerase specialized sigma24 family protein
MPTPRNPVRPGSVSLAGAVAEQVATAGTRPPAVRAATRWTATTPGLRVAGRCPAEIAATGRSAGPAGQDRILADLLAQEAGDGWAELTVLAVLAPRLDWAVGWWRRAGVPAADLADLEADLIGTCWARVRAAMASGGQGPDRPGLALVDRARAETRDRRARQRRQTARQVPTATLPDRPTVTGGETGIGLLSAVTAAAVTAGTLGMGPARALWLTRVAGYTTAETALLTGTSPGVVRVQRARAVRRLAG